MFGCSIYCKHIISGADLATNILIFSQSVLSVCHASHQQPFWCLAFISSYECRYSLAYFYSTVWPGNCHCVSIYSDLLLSFFFTTLFKTKNFSYVLQICLLVSVQLLSRVLLFVTPWTAACRASLSITNSWSLLKLMSIESVMPSNHLILCCPLLFLCLCYFEVNPRHNMISLFVFHSVSVKSRETFKHLHSTLKIKQ